MTTVYNRSKPRREGSRQGKRHIIKSYFCWKKAPKTVEEPAIHKLHSRAHIRLSKDHV